MRQYINISQTTGRWRVYHQSGHVDITSAGAQTWAYYVRDRLGSTRVVINGQGVPLQATDYYPSGIPVETYTTGNAYNSTDRLHTSKEFHAFDGLSWHDNAARFHDALFPRFTTVDPLAEKYPDVSPYVFCNNNPMRFIDPTGMKWESPSDSIQAGKIKVAIMNKIIELNNSKAKGTQAKDNPKRVEQLMDSYSEINQMANAEEQSFMFDNGDENGGKTVPGNPIKMLIVDSTDEEFVMANSIHELKHGYDLWKKLTSETAVDESNAYIRQYSYSPESLPLSDVGGRPRSIDLVTSEWVMGIYSNGKYIYMETVLGDNAQKQKNYLKHFKKSYKQRKSNLK